MAILDSIMKAIDLTLFKVYQKQLRELARETPPLLRISILVFIDLELEQVFKKDGLKATFKAVDDFLDKLQRRFDPERFPVDELDLVKIPDAKTLRFARDLAKTIYKIPWYRVDGELYVSGPELHFNYAETDPKTGLRMMAYLPYELEPLGEGWKEFEPVSEDRKFADKKLGFILVSDVGKE